MRKLIVILGTPIDNLNPNEALARMQAFVERGRMMGKGHQIATINADFVVKSLHDAELRRILQDADMATADGMPLVWSARLLGVPIQKRVTGADMVPALAQLAAERGYSIYLLGAAPGVAQQAAQILQERNPRLQIAGIASPSQNAVANGDPAIIQAIQEARPDILLVAFGNPKQEKWIYHHADELSVPIMMGVGGTFDFIAGVTRRAPIWMQQMGLEWLFRVWQEPRRLWRRYAIDLFGFSYFFFWQWWVMQKGRTPSPVLPRSEVLLVNDTAHINVRGRLDASNHLIFAEKASAALQEHPQIVVNLAEAEFLDSTAIGTLLALTKQAREAGGNLRLVHVPPPIARVLSLLRLEHYFDISDEASGADRKPVATMCQQP